MLQLPGAGVEVVEELGDGEGLGDGDGDGLGDGVGDGLGDGVGVGVDEAEAPAILIVSFDVAIAAMSVLSSTFVTSVIVSSNCMVTVWLGALATAVTVNVNTAVLEVLVNP